MLEAVEVRKINAANKYLVGKMAFLLDYLGLYVVGEIERAHEKTHPNPMQQRERRG
jgi:hypothetical protein